MIIVHKFEHSFMLNSTIKQNKNSWAHSYIGHSYDFVQLYLPKNLGKNTQMTKIQKNDQFL